MMKDVQLQNPPDKGYTGLSNFFLKLENIRFSFHTLSLLALSILFLSFFPIEKMSTGKMPALV